MYLLDTDTCIYLLRGKAQSVAERLRTIVPREVGVTAITAGELRYGALHSAAPHRNLSRVETFLAPLQCLPFDAAAAVEFAVIKQHLARVGTPIGGMDLLIAATVRSVGGTLVTHNSREFLRVPDLAIEDWFVEAG